MSVIAWLDLFSVFFTAAVLGMLWQKRRHPFLSMGIKVALGVLLLVSLVHYIMNFLKWSEIYPAIDEFKDYLEILKPLLWGGLLYVFLQDWNYASLQREHERLQKYFDVMGIIVVVIDVSQQVSLINKKGCEVLGLTEKEILGRNWFDHWVPAADKEGLRSSFKNFIAGKQAVHSSYEGRILNKEKKERTIRWTQVILRDENGRIFGSLIAGEDVTEIQHIQETLKTTKAHERALIDNLSHLAWVKDREGRFILVNQAFAKSCGHNIREIIGKTDLDIWPRPLAEAYRADDAEVMRTQKRKFIEEPIEEKTGRRWFETFKSPIIDQRGNVIGTTGIALDITERKLAEEELKSSEERFRELVASVTDYIYTVKIDQGRAVSTHHGRGCVAVTGYTTEEYARDSTLWYRMVHDEDKPGIQEFAKKIFSGRDVQPLEHRIIHKNGTVRWVRNTAVLQHDGQGHLIGYDGLISDITARKLADSQKEAALEALRQVNQHLTSIFVALPDLFFRMKKDGTILDYKAGRVEDLYLPPESFLGKKMQSVLPPEIGLQFQRAIQDVATGERVAIEYALSLPEGMKTFEARLLAIEGEEIIAVIRDITDRKLFENQLKESETRLRQVIDLVPHFIFAKNRKGRFTLVNQAVAQAYGTTVENLLGKTDADFNPNAAEVEHFLKDDNEVIDSGRSKNIPEEKITDAQGQTRWLHTIKIPYHETATDEEAVLGVSTDITERKRIIQALQESEEKYRILIEAAADAIFVADVETGKILDANKKAEDLIGLPLEKIIGMNQAELHPKGEAHLYQEIFKRDVAAKGKEKHIAFAYNRKKGKIPIQINSQVLELKGRKVIVGIFRDITELKLIEDALRRDKAGLEKVVNERTEVLGKTLRELEDARRLSDIGALAATVAHELRNPLGVIKTAVYNIKQKMKDDSLDRHLVNIDKKIGESELIIKNLLSYAQIKAPTYEKVDALEILGECIEQTRHKYLDSKIEVTIKQRGGRGKSIVQVSSVHVNELFSNILDNAYQAFPERRGKIEIDFDYNEKEGVCKVAVGDNGEGIDKEALPNVFDPFFTTRSRGTGLGLSVCNQIINLYGGHIDLESKKGEGTTVTIALPIRKKG